MLNPIIIKLEIVVLMDGVIGLEREYQYKAAGFCTIKMEREFNRLY